MSVSDGFEDNKYRRWYFQICDRARERPHDVDMERHHVLPRSLGGGNAKSNIVSLTYREHFLAHWLLTKFTNGSAKTAMWRALSCMRCSRHGRALTARQFEVARAALSAATRGKPSPLKGGTKSAETRAKMREAWKNRTPEYFAKLSAAARDRSPATREKLRIAATNLSDQSRANRSASASKRRHTEETKAKLRLIKLGNNHCLGRVLTQETKDKIGAASRARWDRVRAAQEGVKN